MEGPNQPTQFEFHLIFMIVKGWTQIHRAKLRPKSMATQPNEFSVRECWSDEIKRDGYWIRTSVRLSAISVRKDRKWMKFHKKKDFEIRLRPGRAHLFLHRCVTGLGMNTEPELFWKHWAPPQILLRKKRKSVKSEDLFRLVWLYWFC